ncbi:MAG: hypothetical protein ACM3X7_14170 [Solirubrobacterales bacterium]
MIANLVLGVAYDFTMVGGVVITGEVLTKATDGIEIRQAGGVITTLNVPNIVFFS